MNPSTDTKTTSMPRLVDCSDVPPSFWPTVVEIVRANCGPALQGVILFGSRAGGFVGADSDVDLLVILEPPPRTWTSADNLAMRRLLDDAFRPLEGTVDCWVRTTDQFSVARHVAGCVERWADTEGTVLFERPRWRTPQSSRTRDEIRLLNVLDWINGARGHLGRAVQIASDAAAAGRVGRPTRSPQHHAARAIQSALGSLFVLHGREPLPKTNDVGAIVRGLEPIEPAVSHEARSLASSVVTLGMARVAVRLVASRLTDEPTLRAAMQRLVSDVDRPVETLAWPLR